VSTGLRLGTTAVFDYPNPAALAGYLLGEASVGGGDVARGEIERLGQLLTGLPADDADRLRFAAQLRALAAGLEGEDKAGNGAFDSSRLRAASDDEILEFIDAQVGPDVPVESRAAEQAQGDHRG
jgi:hypothetical protein